MDEAEDRDGPTGFLSSRAPEQSLLLGWTRESLIEHMSSLKKLRVTLAIIASRFRRRRRVDFGAPSPHSRRWDERESSLSRHQELRGATASGFNKKMLTLMVVVLAFSVAANLLLSPLVGTAVGLAVFTVMLIYFFRAQRRATR